MANSTRWPAEWEPQAAVLLTWPQPAGDFSDFAAIEDNFVRLAEQIAPLAPLMISADDEEQARKISTQLALFASRVQVFVVPSNDIWVRDHGPVGVLDHGQVRLNKFGFDGWGGKYAADRDNTVVTKLAEARAWDALGEVQAQNFILEGGAIETDGQGTLLATKSSVLDQKRNPGLSPQDMEDLLRNSLGVRRFLWLENGDLQGDDTDGHIDTLARFVAHDHIVYQSSQCPELPNHDALSRMLLELQDMHQSDGRPYKLTALPHTETAHQKISKDSNEILPTSYANFLMLNGSILLPQYGDASDSKALRVLQDACPTHRVVGIDCRALVTQFGSLHCATMNIPASSSTASDHSEQ